MFSERLTGEASLSRELEALSVSQRLVRSVSQKLRKKNHRGEEEEEDDSRGVSLKCLTLYGMGGGCKVGADTGEEFGDTSGRRRSSSASEEGKGHRPICGNEETGFDCFSYGMKEKFWKKSSRKDLELEDSIQNSRLHMFLPDDVLELCLVRLPLTSLMNARLVCKKWRYLTTTPRFLQMRQEGPYLNPWLFLFGAVKDGYCSGDIYALDVSQDQWHRIDSDILKGRFMFSVASFQDDIYVVGGCSSLTHFGRVDRSSFRTHKGVWAFTPLTKSWRKIASMRYARSMPVLGISEVSSDFSVVHSYQHRQERRFSRSRIAGVSDVYEDPHRFSLRRQYRNAFDEYEPSSLPTRKSHKFTRQKSGQSNMKDCKRFVLIAVGGLGSWDEPLDSGEIYDPLTNKWTEIQRLPMDFGAVCSGVICNGMFYVYSETDKLMGYDIERGIWMAIQSSPFPPRVHEYYPKLVSCNGQLFMLSVSWCEGDGQIGQRNKAVRKLWELDLMYLNWTEAEIYVRVYEDQIDLLRATIIGAYGTPYQDGLFFFDFHLPPEYPDVPPSAYYHSGGWRINPNLYEEGKVCLSLLNTWTGRGNEVWHSSSSILQVLVSLQGLVLNSRPYFNEAGYDKQIGTAEGEKNSLSYNENTFLLNCKTMMYLMRKPPKDFEDLVKEHFRRRGYYILKACDAYMQGNLIGSLARDASGSSKESSNLTSVGFKLMLAKIVPKLYLALNEVGADCHEFKHLLQS